MGVGARRRRRRRRLFAIHLKSANSEAARAWAGPSVLAVNALRDISVNVSVTLSAFISRSLCVCVCIC